MGYALMVFALAQQADRPITAAPARATAIEAPTSEQPPRPVTPPPASAAATPSATATASAPPMPLPSAAATASAEPIESPDARLFKFSPGGAAMSRDEVQRLMALGKTLAHRQVTKVSIEGFGDRPGSEALMVGIAKHRAKVAQTLLAKAGVPEDRVSTTFVDMGSETRLALCIRITTSPPLSELDKP